MSTKELVTSVVPMVYKQAIKYAGRQSNKDLVDELASEGVLGAIQAASTWDASKGKFTTYVDEPIKWAINSFFRRQTQKGNRVENSCVENSEEVISFLTSNSPALDEELLLEKLFSMVDGLPKKQKEALKLWLNADTYGNMCHIKLGICRQAFNQRVHVAINNIRKQLGVYK